MNSVLKKNSIEENTYSFSDLLLILSRELKVIIIIPIILCLIMLLYLIFFSKPMYTSTAKIMSSSSTGALSQTAGLAAQLGINFSVPQSEPKWFYPDIIKSRDLAKNVLKKKFYTIRHGSQKTLLEILTFNNKKPKLSIKKLEAIGVNILLQLVRASEDIKTGIVSVSVSAFEPNLSAQINKAFIDELDEHQLKYNKAKMSEAKQFIQERIIIVEKELMAAEEDLKIFNDRNRRIENSPALQLEQQRLGREVTVLTGVFTTLKQQLETTKIEEVKESDYVIIIDSPEAPLQRSKPKKKLMIILVAILGLSFGIIFAFVKEIILRSSKEEKVKMNQVKLLFLKNISDIIPIRWK